MPGLTDNVITALEQVTPAWLTGALSRSGALTRGAVVSFAVGGGKGNWSTNARLEVTYSADAQGTRPARLFLKMVDAYDEEEPFDDSEVTFYTRDYVDVPDAPLLRCYDAAWSPELMRYHILLDDVSATHVEARGQEPTLEYGLALAEALATLHARWWARRDWPRPARRSTTLITSAVSWPSLSRASSTSSLAWMNRCSRTGRRCCTSCSTAIRKP